MSNISGHTKITSTAVKELGLSSIANSNITDATVGRDFTDVLILGHWADFGQKHHFMRQFDSQSPYEAYNSAVAWIKSNSLKAAQNLARDGCFAGSDLQPLGNAVHALEDSFSKGHVIRGAPISDLTPGLITNIKRYAGSEKDGHEKADEEWKGDKAGFSADGRFAINSVKALLTIVMTTAKSPKSTEFIGWQAFRDKWIKADSALNKSQDRVFELIDRYYTGIRIGATNFKTLNMDEDGLAKALLAEGSQTTLDVFVRLDDQYNSDADDVAEIYVNLVRAKGGAVLTALKGNKPLIRRLIKVMDEGWTTSGEQKCIDFLKTLL